MTIDGDLYNLNDCMFAKHNRATVERMFEAIRTCQNVHIQLITKMGKILDIGVYINKQPGDINYESALQVGFVPINKSLLKRVANKTQADIDSNKQMTQDDIDKMIERMLRG